MNIGAIFKKAAHEISEFHLKNRGTLGLAFGLAAGIGLSYTDMAQQTAWAVTGHLIEPEKMGTPAAASVANNILQSMAASIILASVGTDVITHRFRKMKQQPSPQP